MNVTSTFTPENALQQLDRIQEAVSVHRNDHSVHSFFNHRNISQNLIAEGNGSRNEVQKPPSGP